MPADPQKQRVYALEWACETRSGKKLSKTAARDIVHWACDLYGVPRVEFYAARSNSGPSYYSPAAHRIKLIPRHRSAFICLHEAAHAIDGYYHGHRAPAHGPRWLGIYAYLLVASGLVAEKWLKPALKYMRLRATPRRYSTPQALKRRAKK